MTNLLKNNYFLSFLASFFAFGCNFLLREGFVIVFLPAGLTEGKSANVNLEALSLER